MAVALDTPVLYSNLIKGLTTTTLRIEDNVVITGNLSCQGSISIAKPFWIAGKVGSDGLALSSLGKYGFTCGRTATGQYQIIPNSTTPFPIVDYIVQLTFQADGANATGRVVNASVSTTYFNVFTYLNSVTADCAFHFTVIT